MFCKVKPFKGQKYKKLRDDCLANGRLFVDPEFPPEAKSLYFSKSPPDGIEWKRPGELVPDPKLFVDGASSKDFSQGELGNCWFVASCASIAQEEKLWKKVVPDHEEQEWNEDNKYAGIFHFHFFRFGEWIDVVIDDYLPTRNGQLIFMHSSQSNEFWSALLEKAYAKLFGDYESLEAGKARDALVDMMGGVGEGIELKDYHSEDKAKKLFEVLEEAFENHSLMSASIAASGGDMESETAMGLIKGHAYSITSVQKIKLGSGLAAFFKNDKIKMIRCRNPWGGKEWKGPWSDGSAEWKKISESERKELGLTCDDDGEFWMSYNDFLSNFTHMDICHLINTSIFSFRKTWKEGVCVGEWKRPMFSGGCSNHMATFLNNPQYLITVEKDCELIISLEQEDQRMNKEKGAENETVGFTILKTDLNRQYRMHEMWERTDSGPFVNSRSIFKRINLKQGRYVIVPSSFDPGHEGKFMLRVYCGKDPELKELRHDGPQPGFCRRVPKYATVVCVNGAQGLEKQDVSGGGDPYCIIKCDGKKVKTRVIENSLNPEWNERAIFYRNNPNSDIAIEIWNHNVLRDELMGIAHIIGATGSAKKAGVQALNLVGKEGKEFKPGKLYIELKHFLDINQA